MLSFLISNNFFSDSSNNSNASEVSSNAFSPITPATEINWRWILFWMTIWAWYSIFAALLTLKKDFDLEYGSTSIEIQTNTNIKDTDRVVIVDDLVATGGTAIACAELIHENFNVAKENILILSVIDLPELGGSKKIINDGYKLEVLVSYR